MMDEKTLIRSFIKPTSGGVVVQGPGDDCSVMDYDENRYLIASSDCLVENVHFRISDLGPAELAYKALAVNISDISAMGGEPIGIHLSLAIPPSLDEKWAQEFFDSLYQHTTSQNILLLGGDLSRSLNALFINVHITGFVKKSCIQWRRYFSKADVLCVTSFLGDSSAGLHSLLHNQKDNELVNKHFSPPSLTRQSQWLASQPGVVGMMDLSDGLLSDLQTLPEVYYELDLDKIPHSTGLLRYCGQHNLDPFEFSLAGGEDYALLFGCKQEVLRDLLLGYQSEFGESFYSIGTVSTEQKGIALKKNGKCVPNVYKTFEHF